MIAAHELERVFQRPSQAFERLSNGLEIRAKGTRPNREFLARLGEDALETPNGNILAFLARAAGFEDWHVLRMVRTAVAWVVEVDPNQAQTLDAIIEARGMRGKVLEPGLRPSVIAPATLYRKLESDRIIAALMRRASHLTSHGQSMRLEYLQPMPLEGLQLEARQFMRGIVSAELGFVLARALVTA